MARNDTQIIAMPPYLRDVLAEIASKEDRSMSASVRVLIVKRAKELGIVVKEENDELDIPAQTKSPTPV